MKSLSNFSNEALNRAEMKAVNGGCYVQSPTGPQYYSSLSGAKSAARQVYGGTHYCCAGCSGASWCKGC
jgi:hypothetical protein